MPILRDRRDGVEVNTALSNSFGFGGTNASLVLQRYDA
jgi:3-oxoacyl-[acyl-carrier-protein] synthase-1